MRISLRLFLLAAMVVAAACRDDAASGTDTAAGGDAAPGGTMVIASAGEPDMLYPGLATSITGRMITDMLFDRLADIGDDLNIVGDRGYTPALARRWAWGADSLSIAFELDPRARWHDGRPVRASDVKFSFDVHADSTVGSPLTSLIANIDSVSVRDSLTPVFWFRQRTPDQFHSAVYQIPVVPQHVYGSTPRAQLRTADVVRRPVGSGRFRFVRWDAGSRLEVVADTANYRGRAKLDRVVWTLTPDFNAMLARLTAGEADFIENVPADQAARVDSLPNVRVFAYPNQQYAFMGMNLRGRRNAPSAHPVFGDVRVRRALSMAVDRAAMLQNVFGPLGRPSYGPVPSGMGLVDTAEMAKLIPRYDTAAAAALLDSAGWRVGPGGVRMRNGRPLEFSLLTPQSSAPRMRYAVLLQDAFKRIGATVNVETVDFPTFIARQGARDYDAAMVGYGTDPGPGGTQQRWSSTGTTADGPNAEMYSSPVFDAQIDSATKAFDPARARVHTAAAFRQIIADAPGIWLYDPLTLAAAHERIRIGAQPAHAWWAHIADWHIPESARLPRDRIGLAGRAP